MTEQVINIEKFGFIRVAEFEDGRKYPNDGFWEFRVREDYLIRLMVSCDTFTLSYALGYNDSTQDEDYNEVRVANRYKCETQEQFDFLILNGRVGWNFKKATNE